MKIGNYKGHHLNHFELHPLHLQQHETHTHKWRTYDKKEKPKATQKGSNMERSWRKVWI